MTIKLYTLANKFIKETDKFPENFTGIMKFQIGQKQWFLHGKIHRIDGPAIEHANGTKEWIVNHERHRLDGPAIEWISGTKEWCVNHKRHRLGGPAYECPNGNKEYWIDDKQVTELEHNLLCDIMKLKGLI